MNRAIAQYHNAAFKGSGVDQLQAKRLMDFAEQRRTLANSNRINHKLVFINQALFGQLGNNTAAA